MSNRFRPALAVFGLAAWIASAVVAAAQAPVCAGRNLLADLKVNEPAAYDEIRKAADGVENAKTLLWKIESKQNSIRGPSYLFGTLNLTDDRVQKLPPAANAAFDGARRVAIEVEDVSPERVAEAMLTMRNAGQLLLPGTERLDTLLSPADVPRAIKALAKTGLPADSLGRIRPWAAVVMLNQTDCERSRALGGRRALDGEIARRAEGRGVGTVGLETIELQFQALAAVPDADQLAVLKGHLAYADRINDMTETLLQMYLARDLGAIGPLQLALAKKAGVEPKAFEAYAESLLAVRNRRMRDRIYTHVNQGGMFIAVGALHLQGPKGLVNLFREMDYEVTAVE